MRYALRVARCGVNRIVGPRHLRRLAAVGQAPIPVFFYHRVADSKINPWTMTKADFARQIDRLRDHGPILTLAEVQHRILNRQSFEPASAITFDDGYAENFDFALPLLIELALPCTYFVTVDPIRTGRPFPHDVAGGMPLAPNSVDQIRRLADQGIEIGLHTRTHFDFSQPHSTEQITAEITTAHAELSRWIGHPVRYFAFPFGLHQQLSDRVIAEVRRLGMHGFCSAAGEYNLPGTDAFHIRRIHADVQHECFENWLHFDSRKWSRQLVSAGLTAPPNPPRVVNTC
jgi:peptidoglycan/xylan/chitin deacetylase (PgdA/CDA1 family)